VPRVPSANAGEMEKIENALAIRAARMCGLDLNDIGCSGNGTPKATPGRSPFDLNRDSGTAGEQWQLLGDWVASSTQNPAGDGLRVRPVR
jgi:hypothetical protein